MISIKYSLIVFILLVLSACFASTTLFAQMSVSAFSYSNLPNALQSTSSTSSTQSDVQSWPITINTQLKQVNQGESFTLPLPTGELITAHVSERLEFANQDIQLIAHIDGGGRVVLTLGNDVTFGSINTDSSSLSIGLNAQQTTLVDNQSVQSKVDLSNDMRFPPTSDLGVSSARSTSSLTELEARSTQNTQETTIDLLVVYSSEFATLFGTAETRINQLVSFTNTSFADSGILINLRLVDAIEIGFDNTNFETSFEQVFDDLEIILDDATDGEGDFLNLPALRNQTGADLIAVLSANTSGNGGSAGVAWVLNSSESAVTAVSTTMLASNCCDAVFAHELGHNLGSVHQIVDQPTETINDDCDGGYTGFSCGFWNTTDGWSTLMSSGGDKSEIGDLFSNTDNNCMGDTCGLAGVADNRTSFNMSRLVVAEFRDEVIEGIPNNSTSGWLPGVLYNLLGDDED